MINTILKHSKLTIEERKKILSFLSDHEYCYLSDFRRNYQSYLTPFKYYNGYIFEIKFAGVFSIGYEYWKVHIKDKENVMINTVSDHDYKEAIIKTIEFISLLNKTTNNSTGSLLGEKKSVN